MATIKMRMGNTIADICDDPECIANAKKEGFVEVTESKKVEEPKDEKADEVAPKKAPSKKSVK